MTEISLAANIFILLQACRDRAEWPYEAEWRV